MLVIVIIVAFILLLFWWLTRKEFELEKGTIDIIIENTQYKKQKSSNHSEIIKEAEAMFIALQRKYLYSPTPYKVLGDFYLSKGINDKAIEKYLEMIRYLNQDLNLKKLEVVIEVLNSNGYEEQAQQIISCYTKAKLGGSEAEMDEVYLQVNELEEASLPSRVTARDIAGVKTNLKSTADKRS